jgi:hypothetical protein
MRLNFLRPFIISLSVFLVPIINEKYHTYSYGFFLLALVINILYKINLSKKLLLLILIVTTVIIIQIIITSGLNPKAVKSSIVLVYCLTIFISLEK